MKEHILIENAFVYNVTASNVEPKGCSYLQKEGYWVNNSDGEIMMLSSSRMPSQTKKCDRETGEDQKGE